MTSPKKSDKAQAKREKKSAKAQAKLEKKKGMGTETADGGPTTTHASSDGPSVGIRFAEFVRGCLYVLTGTSLVVAIVLGQRGAIISLNDVIDNLFAAAAGKVVLVLIGLALFLYGLKHLRLVR